MATTNTDSFFVNWTPRLLSLLRIIAGFLFMAHGAQKLFGFLAPPGAPSPALMSQMGIGGVLEFFGGLLLLLGLFTRPVAFILSGMMAVAYFQMHAPGGFWPLQNKGELAVLYCFLFLFLAVAGGGEWSLDRLLRRGSRTMPLAGARV
ncbi:MAG TPA: DoxX family protein [Pyrinomonadaceae bacterium]|jgi:putative oxidoreductase|nr:DoxX family protein [Pyrinomonadaceae bacterium]